MGGTSVLVKNRRLVDNGCIIARHDDEVFLSFYDGDISYDLKIVISNNNEDFTEVVVENVDRAYIRIVRPWNRGNPNSNGGDIDLGTNGENTIYLSFWLEMVGPKDSYWFKFIYNVFEGA